MRGIMLAVEADTSSPEDSISPELDDGYARLRAAALANCGVL